MFGSQIGEIFSWPYLLFVMQVHDDETDIMSMSLHPCRHSGSYTKQKNSRASLQISTSSGSLVEFPTSDICIHSIIIATVTVHTTYIKRENNKLDCLTNLAPESCCPFHSVEVVHAKVMDGFWHGLEWWKKAAAAYPRRVKL